MVKFLFSFLTLASVLGVNVHAIAQDTANPFFVYSDRFSDEACQNLNKGWGRNQSLTEAQKKAFGSLTQEQKEIVSDGLSNSAYQMRIADLTLTLIEVKCRSSFDNSKGT